MVVHYGMRVESKTDFQAVMMKGKPVNHILHLLLTLFTFGLWIIVWIMLAVTGGEERYIVYVDEYGNFGVEASTSPAMQR